MNRYSLAESPIWLENRKEWLFVEILSGAIFVYPSAPFPECRPGGMLSNIVETAAGLLISGESNLSKCDWGGHFISHKELNHTDSLRCNDGSVGPDGKYWFGTMEKAPSGLNGRLYSMDCKGTLVDQNAEIGIPNSFIWLDDRFVLISDSFLQKTFKVELLESGKLDWSNREVWLDLGHTGGTPDGGALDVDGNIWLAVWGDASIHKYSPAGVLLGKMELDALQPTSCAFGGANMDEMLITTATEGLSSEQLRKYPDSGKVLLRQMDVKGKVLPVFNLEV